jgi:hypothetical protein
MYFSREAAKNAKRSDVEIRPKQRMHSYGGIQGVSKLDYMNPRITASPRRPQGGGAMP